MILVTQVIWSIPIKSTSLEKLISFEKVWVKAVNANMIKTRDLLLLFAILISYKVQEIVASDFRK